MGFGQAVVGPPGSGKTTYCWGLQQYFKAISRPILVVNLDPAADQLSYEAAIDIRELIRLEEVMEFHRLGPNGSILFCLEFLEKNFDWFSEKLAALTSPSSTSYSSAAPGPSSPSATPAEEIDYIVLDLPGQVEISTDHESLKNVLHKLEKLDWRLAVVQLTDSTHIVDPIKYISIVLLNLKTMLHLGLPQVNVLTKIDLLKHFNEDFKLKLEFYTDVQDLSYLLPMLENQISPKFTNLNKAIIELIEDFNLVGFESLCVEDKSSMTRLILTIDKALGYYPSHRPSLTNDRSRPLNPECAPPGGEKGTGERDAMSIDGELGSSSGLLSEIQERWIDYPELYDQFQRQLWADESELVLQRASQLNQINAIQQNKQQP
ncbi:hypothetical protein PTTG_00005 [Puccinia triticina 1-1 BBBD Race 1]|uniref:GPN-loop GTPase 2 n=2 Tax=Puccinia triticina TaxID=208348 RepID=A0A0C4EGY9_PUCT1|nr:uncharacterized protein PtA15_4A118 [Puccinia triticina]OAV99182.1 hypothetical protein PTTG_00005 [Puccinia triticina 1-1 BBBD Race 1]WAQ83670.1 hypothetical protein PtA15_4A118 [Puccinia triticina]WAR54518.1 hypothetical protein PtB15_4B135 [Puccinia triticina]